MIPNEEKARELAARYFPCGSEEEAGLQISAQNALMEMAEWKERQFVFHDKIYAAAKRDGLTNKEFREMLEKYPDDALISVECCHPRGMEYDKDYNLIRID